MMNNEDYQGNNMDLKQYRQYSQGTNPEVTTYGVCKQYLHYGKCLKEKNCEFSHDPNKVQICYNFKQQKCNLGDLCEKAHKKDDVCKYFMTQECKKDNCPFRHILYPCKFFDMGFCHYGLNCSFSHIQKVLCTDYMYGFCPQGPECAKAHPNLFTTNDLYVTKLLREVLIEEQKPTFPLIVQCFKCKLYGHKANNCPQQEVDANKITLCGLCEKEHKLCENCPE